MPLYLTESDVAALLTPADAVEVIDECFRRLAGGEIVNAPRRRLRLQEGALADMAASDLELGLAGGKLYAASPEGAAFVVCIFETGPPRLAGVLEANHLGRLRTGAASAVAARYLSREGARTLGVLGCGWQAETQVACVRAALPELERVIAYCRTAERLAAFCELVGAESAEGHREGYPDADSEDRLGDEAPGKESVRALAVEASALELEHGGERRDGGEGHRQAR